MVLGTIIIIIVLIPQTKLCVLRRRIGKESFADATKVKLPIKSIESLRP